MTSKNFHKRLAKVRKSPDHPAPHKETLPLQPDPKELHLLLEKIDLSRLCNRCFFDQTHEDNIRRTIRYVHHALDISWHLDWDYSEVCKHMKPLIGVLEDAVNRHFLSIADYACAALILSAANLLVPPERIYSDMHDMMLQCRNEYSVKLRDLTLTIAERERLLQNLHTMQEHHRNDSEELKRRVASFKARMDSGELKALLPWLHAFPAPLPPIAPAAAKALHEELRSIHLLKQALLEMENDLHTMRSKISAADLEIRHHRSTLSSPPLIRDPRLREKVDEANRLYREQLRRQFQTAQKVLCGHGSHILEELIRDSLLDISVSTAIRLDMDRKNEKHRNLDLAQQDRDARLTYYASAGKVFNLLNHHKNPQLMSFADLTDIDNL